MIWATVSSLSYFCWLYRASPSLDANNIINLISVLIIWGCPCVESSLVLLKMRWWNRRTCAHLPQWELQNFNSLLNNHWQIVICLTKKDPPQIDTPHPRAKEKPQQDGRSGKITFRIKPYTCQRCSEGSNKTLCAPGPRVPRKTEPDLPLSVWVSPMEARVSSGLPQQQGLWV